jgi:hypothetical protein
VHLGYNTWLNGGVWIKELHSTSTFQGMAGEALVKEERKVYDNLGGLGTHLLVM